MTPEQKEAWVAEVAQAATESRFPDPDAWGGGPRRPEVAQPVAGSGDEDVFSAADLTLDMLPPGREYQIPGTKKRVWIFGATTEDTELMLSWSLSAENLVADPTDPNRARLAQARMMQDLKLSQVALCCRKGPKRSDGRVFGRQDIPALRSRLGSAVVEEIVRISNELSGNEEALGGSVRRFFGAIRHSLQTSLSACAIWEDCPDGLLASQTRLLSLVTRALSRGSVDTGLLNDLAEWEGLL